MPKSRAEIADQLKTARKSIQNAYPKERASAYHHAGHALVATLLNVPVKYVSIRPRGQSEGRCPYLQARDEESMSIIEYLHSVELVIKMAGIVAAEIGSPESSPLWLYITALDDIMEASESARRVFAQEQPSNLISRKGRCETEEEYVERSRVRAYRRAKALLTTHNDLLHLIAGKLFQHRYLHGRDLARLIDGRTQVSFMPSATTEYILRFGKEGEVVRKVVYAMDSVEASSHPTLSDALRDLISTPDNSPEGWAALWHSLQISLKDQRCIRARLKTET